MQADRRARLREAARIGWLGTRNVLRALAAEDLRLRALALTTITLFALVPALVVAFSFLQAFAGADAVWRRAQDFLIENLAVGARASIEPHLQKFLRNAHATGAGLVGGGLLVASAVTLFGNVERALDELWAVRRRRPLVQRALIYWGGLTLGPVLLAASLTVAHRFGEAAPSPGHLLARAGSIGLVCLLFSALYLAVPNTQVRLGAGLLGGVVAGVVWEIAKGLYTWAVAHVFRYDAIYGSVAAVPIFLLWLYISWTVVLFGARVAFVAQHARQLVRSHDPEKTRLGRELLAARALLAVARAFHAGAAAPGPGAVAAALEVAAEPVRQVLSELRSAELIQELAGGGLVPARPLDRITLADVRRAFAGGPPALAADASAALLSRLLVGAEGAAEAELAHQTLADLCRTLGDRPPPCVEASP